MFGNFKVFFIFGLGSIIVFVLVMYMYRGGPAGVKHADAYAELTTLFNVQQMNYVSEGHYCKTTEQIKKYIDIKSSFYTFFITPDEFFLNEDEEIKNIPQNYRDMAYVDFTGFKIVAVGNIDSDDSFDVWTVDEKHNFVHVFDDDKD